MPYVFRVGAIQGNLIETELGSYLYTCRQAHKACRPMFVFSISGQVGFRHALRHMKHCSRGSCQKLRRAIKRGFQHKIAWLRQEDAYLGCTTAQNLLYNSSPRLVTNQAFTSVAEHLAHCPKETCAQLRRAVLLTIRSVLNPTPRNEG